MNLWFRLFCFILVLNSVIMEPPKFMFDHITLGHSGFLITWKPKVPENIYFKFGYRIKEVENTTFSMVPYLAQYEKSPDQFKIHSLEQNTLYEVVIKQYRNYFIEEPEAEYLFEMKTNPKTNTKPAKPDFELIYSSNDCNVIIRWYPCGRDRNCNGKEAGTHFAIKFKAIDDREEYKLVICKEDFSQGNILYFGVVVDVVVTSINGDSENDSDPQQMVFEPGSSAVTSVNVNSFSNGTILVSWKPPKHLLEDSVDLYEISYVNPSLLNSDIYCSKYFVNINSDGLIHYVWTTRAHTEVLLGNPEVPFKPGNTYTFTITPRWWSGPVCYGLPFKVKHTVPVDKDNGTMGKDDF